MPTSPARRMATCDARINHFSDAIAVLATIPDANQTGDLALVPYLLADCEIRTLAPEADDALTAERLIETAEDAAKYLDAFINSQPKVAAGARCDAEARLLLSADRRRQIAVAGRAAQDADQARDVPTSARLSNFPTTHRSRR